jgi:hypothetical protein
VEAYKTQLAQARPVAVAIPTYDSWFLSPEVRRSGRITMRIGDEVEAEGQAFVVVGYQNSTSSPGGGYFIVRNSWGTAWAYESPYGAGYGTIPYKYIADDAWEVYSTTLDGPVDEATTETRVRPREIPPIPVSPDARFDMNDGNIPTGARPSGRRRLRMRQGGRQKRLRSRSMWAGRVDTELERICGELNALETTGDMPPRTAALPPILESIEGNLKEAREVLDKHFRRCLLGQIFGATGAYQAALSAVYRASEDLFLVQNEAAVKARLPDLRAAIRAYLSADDPRRESYLLYIDTALIATAAEKPAMAAQPLTQSAEPLPLHEDETPLARIRGEPANLLNYQG